MLNLRPNYSPLKQRKLHRLEEKHNLPFALIALSCHESILKTAWNLNKRLKIDLSESELAIEVKDDPSQKFAVYCDRETSPVRSYCLISNRISNLLLVKELANIDFLLEITGDLKKTDLEGIIREIKKVPGVTAALEVDPKRIKRKSAFCPE
jgi:hypothetical protein